LERARNVDPHSPQARAVEWATPTLMVRASPEPLFAQTQNVESLVSPRQRETVAGRRVDHFIGRRRESRLALTALRAERRGVVLCGIAGSGKSALAEQLVSELVDAGFAPVHVSGVTSPASLREAVAHVCESVDKGVPEASPLLVLEQFEQNLTTRGDPWA